ncbi:MAG: hypothetical protein ACRC6T_03585 [Sarcina sp.]
MNTYTFKNSKIKEINTNSKITSKLININSEINTLNLNTPLCILSGEFETKVNIINNCHLNLNNDFILKGMALSLLNENNEEKEIILTGNLQVIRSDLNIISDNNISIKCGISSTNKTDKTINLTLNAASNENDFFKINSFDTQNNVPLSINFKSTNTKNIIINGAIENFNAEGDFDINLIVSTKSTINKFQNITNETFNSVIASEQIIDILESDYGITVPVKSILFKVHMENGKGTVSMSKKHNILDKPKANLILSSKRFNI